MPDPPPIQARPDAEPGTRLDIGILAVQGDFAAHGESLRGLGAEVSEVRRPDDLDDLDGLVIPGGESTTITKGIVSAGLEPRIREHHRDGRPILGTCAGMIVCDREHMGLIDISARRNAFGRQLQSFETDLRIEGLGEEPMRAVFIRAPWVESAGPGVEILAAFEDHPVAVRAGPVLSCAFHPELTDDSRIHALFMAMATSASERRSRQTEEASS